MKIYKFVDQFFFILLFTHLSAIYYIISLMCTYEQKSFKGHKQITK